MKKLESLIKIKTINLDSLNSELLDITEKINDLNAEIDKKNKNIQLHLKEYSLDSLYIIDKIKKQYNEVLIKLKSEQEKMDSIKQKIISVKQEIRALELLIEKRKTEIRKEKDKNEQNELDELNSLD